MSIELWAEKPTIRKDYETFNNGDSISWNVNSPRISKPSTVASVAILSFGVQYWGGSCAGWLLANLAFGRGALYDTVTPVIPDNDRVILAARHLNAMQGRANWKNFWYLARTEQGNTGPVQTEQIKFLEELGFERIKGSRMRNPNHDTELYIYGRLVQ